MRRDWEVHCLGLRGVEHASRDVLVDVVQGSDGLLGLMWGRGWLQGRESSWGGRGEMGWQGPDVQGHGGTPLGCERCGGSVERCAGGRCGVSDRVSLLCDATSPNCAPSLPLPLTHPPATSAPCTSLLSQDVCVELEVRDATSLPAAVRSMMRVVSAAPRMERWIGDVCQAVYGEQQQQGQEQTALLDLLGQVWKGIGVRRRAGCGGKRGD